MRTLVPVTFDASEKTVTFTGLASIELRRVLLVSNITDGIVIFNGLSPNKGGSVATNVLTLEYDTTTMDDADIIQAFYEVDDVNGTVSDAAITTDTTGSISGKLRGLVKIFADVWDSVTHALKVTQATALVKTIDAVTARPEGSIVVPVTASGIVSAVPCIVVGVYVASTTAGTLKNWDNASAGSGAVIDDTFTPAVGWHPLGNAQTLNGLYVTVGGTISASYRIILI